MIKLREFSTNGLVESATGLEKPLGSATGLEKRQGKSNQDQSKITN